MEIDINSSTDSLTQMLQQLGWMKDEQIQNISKAGEGNMNVVLRVTTDQKSFILKQSRAYVQKYPDIPAPIDRINVEALYYSALKESSVATHLPTVLQYDKQHHLLMMEDLGMVEDLTSIYANRSISTAIVDTLVKIAHQTHTLFVPDSFPANLELRQLNHQHIFHLPFLADNGFSLDDVQPGLQTIAAPYQQDTTLSEIISQLGEAYLAPGGYLLHGDYYPGSWMTVAGKLYVLDPEFAHLGQREFDLGVMSAHMMMATHDDNWPSKIIDIYPDDISHQKVYQYAGIEVMRRLIGLAQLPLSRSLKEKAMLLETAKRWIL